MMIRKANGEDVVQCMECIEDSQLWDAYFEEDHTTDTLEKEIQRGRVIVAVDEENRLIGFMGIKESGCFGQFPYLSILAVHKEHRNRGVGKKLLHHFEQCGFEKENRVFLLCSDFNERGHMFYLKNGYAECGVVPDLYKKGIAEHIFVKYKDDTDKRGDLT